MKADVSIKGIQELQAYNIRAIAALQPDGATGRAIQHGTAALHRYATIYTHVITGSLRGSHRMAIEAKGMRGVVFIDPKTVNPRTRQKPSDYGITEHERGGSHAFYQQAVDDYGGPVLKEMGDIIIVRGLM